MHLGETLQFLHAEARLAHSNVNPETVLITKDGGWKLAGFAFVGSAEGFGSGGGAGGTPVVFEYSGAGGGLALWDEVMQVRVDGGGGRCGGFGLVWGCGVAAVSAFGRGKESV